MRRAGLVVCLVVLGALLVAPVGAQAATQYFSGSNANDPATDVTFTVTGKYKKVKKGGSGNRNKKPKKVFVPSQVSEVHVINQYFNCVKADGSQAYYDSGAPLAGYMTSQYAFFQIPPMAVDKNGKFSGEYQFVTNGHTIEHHAFAGQIKNQSAKGTYRAQYAAGGIEFGYCGDQTPAPWKGGLSPLEPLPVN
ncbi:MAG: hypothetical protein QOG62_738 [Thermoleophilaceae bacterium]|jgi:hypothetical protein|nr:hypothetical protein [Thermoleophilaceae bacterium]